MLNYTFFELIIFMIMVVRYTTPFTIISCKLWFSVNTFMTSQYINKDAKGKVVHWSPNYNYYPQKN